MRWTKSSLGRDGLNTVIRKLEAGEANILLIYDIDRLSRKYTGYAGLRRYLHKRGIKIYVSSEKQFISPFAKQRLSHDVKALVGDVEWETIKERMDDGRWCKINELKRVLGGGIAPYGYRWEGYGRDRYLVIDEEAAEVVRLIFHLYVYGNGSGPLSTIQIAH